MKNHVVKVGFMGAGKTEAGTGASRLLDVPFYDTDARVIEVAGMSISDIFDSKGGEAEFRKLEIEALNDILDRDPGVVSTGGGIVSTQAGRRALVGCGAKVVWMEVDFDTAKHRAQNDSKNVRPLFRDPEKARMLFDQRQGWYEEVSTARVDASQPLAIVTAQLVSIASTIR